MSAINDQVVLQAINMCEKFLDIYPDAEFGPAHITLSDYNFKDCHLMFCVDRTYGALNEARVKLPMRLNGSPEPSPEMQKVLMHHFTIELLIQLFEILEVVPDEERNLK